MKNDFKLGSTLFCIAVLLLISFNPYVKMVSNGSMAFAVQLPVKIDHNKTSETWLLPNGQLTSKFGGEAPPRLFPEGIKIEGETLKSSNVNVDLISLIDSEIIYKNNTSVLAKENWFIYKSNLKINWNSVSDKNIFIKDMPVTETVSGYTVTDYEKEATMERTLYNIFGILLTEYKIHEAEPLKHTLNFTATQAGIYKLCQEFSELDFDSIKQVDEDTNLQNQVKEINTIFIKSDKLDKKTSDPLPENVEFIKEGKLILGEITSGAKQNFQSFEYDSLAKTAKFCYGDFTLKKGESFLIDPDTYTSNNPTEDGGIVDNSNSNTCDTSPTVLLRLPTDGSATVGTEDTPEPTTDCYRAYFEYDITSIPDSAQVSNTVFKFEITAPSTPNDCDYMEMNSQPSTASDSTLWGDVGDGTVFVNADATCKTTGTNKSVDLGTAADDDVEAQLTTNWWALGIKSDSEAMDATQRYTNFITEESIGTPDPTLEITYTASTNVTVTINHYTGNSTALTTCNITQTNSSTSSTKACNSSGIAVFTGLQNNQNFTVKETNTNFVVNKTRNFTPATNLVINATVVEVNCIQTGSASDIRLWFNQTDGHTYTNFTRPVCTTSNQQPIVVSWNVTASPDGKNSATYNADLRVEIRNQTAFGKNAINFFHNGKSNTTSYSTGIITSSDFPIGSGTATSSTLRKFYLWLDAKPDIPTGLSVVSASSSQLNLSWTAGNSGVSPITGYKIERESPVGGGFSTLVADTGTTATTYSDTGLTSSTQYNYRISAINSYGTGSSSSAASGTAGGAVSSGGGGGGGGLPPLAETLIGLQIFENYHQANPADQITSTIKMSWPSDKPITVKNIDASEFTGWITYEQTPFQLKSISVQEFSLLKPAFAAKQEGEFTININIPRQFCNPDLGITQNCVEEKLYNIILKLTLEFNEQEYQQNVKISIDLRPVKLSPALIQTMILGTVMIGAAFGGIQFFKNIIKKRITSNRKPSKIKGLGKSKFEKEVAKVIS